MPEEFNWTHEVLSSLGTASDRMLAELGTKSDAKLASQYGVSTSIITRLRSARGIPSDTKRRAWRPDELEMLGKFPDAEVARRTGRTISAVKFERMNRRISRRGPAKVLDLDQQYRQPS